MIIGSPFPLIINCGLLCISFAGQPKEWQKLEFNFHWHQPLWRQVDLDNMTAQLHVNDWIQRPAKCPFLPPVRRLSVPKRCWFCVLKSVRFPPSSVSSQQAPLTQLVVAVCYWKFTGSLVIPNTSCHGCCCKHMLPLLWAALLSTIIKSHR